MEFEAGAMIQTGPFEQTPKGKAIRTIYYNKQSEYTIQIPANMRIVDIILAPKKSAPKRGKKK